MTLSCPPPDPALGTVLRLTGFLDCHAERLGREGFLALAGDGLSGGLVAGLLTIAVALVGYRLLLGNSPDLREGVGWTVRVGAVLALLAGWPAFQVLFYDVALAAPGEIATRLLEATGIPAENVPLRQQRTYDTLRLGIAVRDGAAAGATELALAEASGYQFQPPMPRTAGGFLLGTAGFVGAARMTAAFLLAIAPFPIMALILTPAFGLFVGWLRALAATLFATIGAIVAASLQLLAVEAEIARIQQSVGIANAATADADAVTVIVVLFGLLTLALAGACVRLAGAISPGGFGTAGSDQTNGSALVAEPVRSAASAFHPRPALNGAGPGHERVALMTDALNDLARRRENRSASSLEPAIVLAGPATAGLASRGPGRTAARSALGRRHRSIKRRDATR